MQVLSFVNQKGGCGKTTAAVNLAGALAARGRRVLLVDLDPQAHATLAFGCAPDEEEGPTVFEVLCGDARIDEAALAAPGGVWLLPATARLSEFEDIAARRLRPERELAARLAHVQDIFDLVLVDCPPRTDGVLTANALRASTTAVLVVETGAFALQGAIQAEKILRSFESDEEPGFDVRVLATLFDRRLVIAREILIALQARFGALLFETVIRESVHLRQAAAVGAPVQVAHPAARTVLDFAALAGEVLALGDPVLVERTVDPVARATVSSHLSTVPRTVLK